jgi:diguanylate cyclase (GGDEF)-like protein/PAS domain S-box-containing protein
VFRVLPVDELLVIDDHQVICFAGDSTTRIAKCDAASLEGRMAADVLTTWPPASPLENPGAHASPPPTSPDLEPRRMTVRNIDGRDIEVDVHVAAIALEGRSWTLLLVAPDAYSFEEDAPRSWALRERRYSQLNAAVVVAESQERFRHSFEDNMAPMMFTDINDRIIAVNDAFCQMIGWPREKLLHSDSTPFTYPEDIGISETTHHRLTRDEMKQARYVKRYLHRDGRIVVVEISKSTAFDVHGNFLYFVISERDVTEERALSAQLTHQALHDPLTGLANRAVFEDRLHQAQSRVARLGGFGAVLLMDLDDFKGVNDTHGHVVGDQLLTALAHRLENETRSSDTLCRFGGDEFLYLAEGLKSPDEAEQLAIRLREVIARPLRISGLHLEVRSSIGVVVWDSTESDDSQIIQNADSAMYEAKRRGKGNYVIFTAKLQQQAVNRFALTQELRQAIQAGELSMFYQPILDLATNRVVGFEALMRWQHPERGFVPPSVFIALAEQSDLILELGAFAINEAVGAASSWARDPRTQRAPFVTVNFSARQFHDPDLISSLVNSLLTHGLEPERLIIEITESATLLDVAETLQVIEYLKRLGIGIALDDFGTGYSSLSYLTLLHPRVIKIDRSFVSPSHESIHNDTLLQTIISLGQKLNMIVLAEGIETPQQLERLRELGGELGQGFLFSPAVPLEVVDTLLGAELRP